MTFSDEDSDRTQRLEWIFNWMMGLTFWFSAYSVFFLSNPMGPPVAIRVSCSVLLIVVGTLSLLRHSQRKPAGFAEVVGACPSLICGWFVFHSTPEDWKVVWQLTFVAGTALAIVSFVFLGRSFAIFPGVRKLRTGGPYSWVRHPAYLGELVMLVSVCFSIDEIWSYVLMVGAVAGTIVRILVEERLLRRSVDYSDYQRRVPFRLLPHIW